MNTRIRFGDEDLLIDLEAIFEPLFTRLLNLERNIMAAIDDLKTAVAAEDTVIASAITLINGFAAQLAAAGTDPAALAQLQADVTAQSQALAAAVAANTPAAPPAAAPAPASSGSTDSMPGETTGEDGGAAT